MIRILIADDNDAARGILKEMLEAHEGWQVCGEAEDGWHALAKARDLKPNIVVLDLAMPALDGLTAAREIGKVLPGVPILIYTLHDGHLIELEAKKAGVRKVVSKTDLTETLIAAIEDVLNNEGSRVAAPGSVVPEIGGLSDGVNIPEIGSHSVEPAPAEAVSAESASADSSADDSLNKLN